MDSQKKKRRLEEENEARESIDVEVGRKKTLHCILRSKRKEAEREKQRKGMKKREDWTQEVDSFRITDGDGKRD